MRLQQIDVRKTIAASPVAVFHLLGDSSTWPAWTPIESFELLRPGDRDGVGEIRVFGTGRVHVREEIVERIPEQRLSYVLLGGLAVRDYRAVVDIEPVGDGGTAVRWHTTFAPKVPWTGWLYTRALTKATQQFVDGLATQASKRGSAEQPQPDSSPQRREA